MKNSYTIKVAPRNEGIEYEDETGVYRFNAIRERRLWTIYLPPTCGPDFNDHILSDFEKNKILPRITAFLKRKNYLVFS